VGRLVLVAFFVSFWTDIYSISMSMMEGCFIPFSTGARARALGYCVHLKMEIIWFKHEGPHEKYSG
jgi:hypothetical protein